MSKIVNRSVLLYWSIYIFICACYSFIFMSMPFVHDDWWYLGDSMYIGADSNGHHSFLKGVFYAISSHYSVDNSRLANTFNAFFLLFPKWIASLLSSICFIIGFYFFNKLANIKPGNWLKLIVLSFLMVFIVLWEDHMFSHVYTFNYIIILPFFLGAIYWFINSKNNKLWIAVSLGLIIGAWHESYAITLLAGGTCLLLFKQKNVTKWRIALLLSTFIGMIWLFVFPGAFRRAESHFELNTFIYLVAISTLCFIFLGYICLKKRIKIEGLYFFVIAPCFVLIPVMFATRTPRVVMPVIFLVVCAITNFLTVKFHTYFSNRSFLSKTIAALLFVLVALHLVSVCIDTLKLRHSVDSLISATQKLNNGEDEVVFDAYLPTDYNILSLNRPDYNFFDNCYFLNVLFNRSDAFRIIPSVLKNYNPDNAFAIEKSPKFKFYNGYIVTDYSGMEGKCKLLFEYGLLRQTVTCYRTAFITEDGLKYDFIMPSTNFITSVLDKPKGIYSL